jgi:hypothetical protein
LGEEIAMYTHVCLLVSVLVTVASARLAGAQCSTCPPGSIIEQEANCGTYPDTVNGGCNHQFGAKYPYYGQLVPLGATVCGTAGSTADDWRLSLTQATLVELDYQSGPADGGWVDLYWLGPPGQLCAIAGSAAIKQFNGQIDCASFTERLYLPAGEYSIRFDLRSVCQPYTFTLRDAPRPPRPLNDECAGAVEIPSEGQFATSVELTACDAEPEVPMSVPSVATAWYRYTAVRDGTLSVGPTTQCPVFVAVFNPVYSWYESQDGTCSTLTELATSRGSCWTTMGVQVTAGRTYYIQVGHARHNLLRGTRGRLDLTWHGPNQHPPGSTPGPRSVMPASSPVSGNSQSFPRALTRSTDRCRATPMSTCTRSTCAILART